MPTGSLFFLYEGVRVGRGSTIAEYAVIGVPPKGTREGEHPTVIGSGSLIRSHTVIYAGVAIGDRFQSGHGTLIREFTEIGDDVSIGSHSVIEHRVTIGNRVRIHSQAFVPELSVLEDDCWIGPNVVLTNSRHPHTPEAKENLEGVVVRSGARIGANSTILPGVEIGRGSLVGAGSVVTRSVPSNTIVAGNPARVLRNIGPAARA